MSSTSASSDPAASRSERILVGVVSKPHGIRGEVKVDVLTDVEGRFAVDTVFALVARNRSVRKVRIAGSRRHQGAMLLRFEGVEDRRS